MEKEKKKRIKEKKNSSKQDLKNNINSSIDIVPIKKKDSKKNKKDNIKSNRKELRRNNRNNKNVEKTKTSKKNKIIRTFIYILMIICIGVFCFSTYKIVYRIIDGKKTKETTKEIFEKVDIEVYTSDDLTEEEPENDYVSPYWKFMNTNFIDVNLNELKQTNKDTKGWLQVPGTNINYPFVQTNNNSYYLTHSFEGGYNECGWVFLDYRNDKDLTKNRNSIIYGHRRADQAMFGSLKNVLKKDWQKNINNHYIKISLEHYNLLYKIFSVYHLPVTSDYIQTDFDDNNEFKEFLNMIKNRSSYNFYTDVNETDTILTLSSCYGDNERVVVHAKLIQKQGK